MIHAVGFTEDAEEGAEEGSEIGSLVVNRRNSKDTI